MEESHGKEDPTSDSATEKVAFYFDPRDLVPEPLFCCDVEGWILWLNRAAEQLLGRPAHELIGNSFAELFPPDDRNRTALHFVRQHWRGVTESYWEAPLVSASGRSHWAGMRLRLLRAGNGRMVYVCSAHDLQAIHSELEETKRKVQAATSRADEAAAAAELKSEFLATTSQELRVPMSGVIGMSRLLLESELNRDQRMFAEVIQNSAESLLGLVDDVLDYSRIEAARLTLQHIDFDLRVAADAAAATLSSRAGAKGLLFAFGVHHRVPSLLTGDPGRLRQVLLSLAGNTIQFAESGEVSLRVDLTEETPRTVTLRFWLRAGKSAAPTSRTAALLRAFANDDSVLVREFGSTGLGLSISRRLVALMGGQVGIVGNADPGIAIWIDLPFEKQAERKETASEGAVEIAGLRVLVIGSVAATRLGIVETVTALDCRCTEKEDAEGALEEMRRAAREGAGYRLVFVDYDPAGFDPGALARSIRSDKALSASSLVLTTIIGRQGDAARAEEWSYAAYLVMPLERDDLREAMAEVLRRSSAAPGTSGSAGPSLVTRHSIAEQRRQRIRVLLVEDDPVDQLVISGALRRMGYDPCIVKSGGEALEAVRRQPFDIIFLDIVMPDLTGWEVASIIRKEKSGGRRTPIIATTALDSQEDRAHCREAGMDGCLSKPLDFEAMAAMIECWTSKDEPSSGDRPTIASLTAESPAAAETSATSSPEHEGHANPDVTRVDESVPVLDVQRLEISCLGNDELRTLLITAFSVHNRPPMQRLGAAIEAGDAAAVELESHTLRGMCASLGADRSAILFQRLESGARDGNQAHWRDLYRCAQAELARVDDRLCRGEQAA